MTSPERTPADRRPGVVAPVLLGTVLALVVVWFVVRIVLGFVLGLLVPVALLGIGGYLFLVSHPRVGAALAALGALMLLF